MYYMVYIYVAKVLKTKMYIVNVHTDKLLDCDLQRTDPASHQRGRPTETRQQISGQTSTKWARHQDILTVSRKVTLTLRIGCYGLGRDNH
jgi:hypothetical protein